MPIAVRFHLRAALIAAALLALLAVAAQPAGAVEQLGRKPARCGVGCWGDASRAILSVSYLADFTIDPLIARPGEKVTGTVAPSGNEALTGWVWPLGRRCPPNTLTCTWRAGAATRRWQVIGMGWQNIIGRAITEAVYAVVGKDDAVLEGYVRDKAGDGVGKIGLRVSLIGGRGSKMVYTGGDGYYNLILKAGKYSVIPLSRAGKRDEYEPASRTVTVKKGKETRADFELDVSLKVTITPDQRTLVADGLAKTDLLVKAERDGKPVEGLKVDVWPLGSSPAEKAPVPLTICRSGARFWPTELPGVAGAAIPDSVTTDANGQAVLQLRAGTIAGKVSISAWAETNDGRLRRQNREDVQDIVDLTFTPRPVGSTGQPATYLTFKSLFLDFAKTSTADLITSSPDLLANQLMDAAPGAGFGNLTFHPIYKPSTGESGVLVTTADTRFELTKDQSMTSNAGLVIPYRALNFTYTGPWHSFAGAARVGQLPDFLSTDVWRAGLAPPFTWDSKAAPTTTPTPGWAYYGWPRPLAGCA
jgi:hypothetical protein